MKLSVNEAKLTGLWAGNCDTIQQVVILIFAFGPRKVSGFFEKQAQSQKIKVVLKSFQKLFVFSSILGLIS